MDRQQQQISSKEKLLRKRDKIIWALFLNHACNLNCGYCYLKNINDDKRMDRKLLKNVIDRIIYLSKRAGKVPEIGFFGKEPLINFRLLKDATLYIRESEFNCGLSVNTNGTLLNTDIIDFLKANNFRIVLSFDFGVSEKNNIQIFDGFNKDNIDLRTTVCPANLMNIPETVRLCVREGFQKLSIGFDYSDKGWKKYTYKEIADVLTESVIVYLKYISRGCRLSVPLFDRIIENGIMRKKWYFSHQPFCRIGRRIFSIDTNGDVYPCWRFADDPGFKLGNIVNDFEIEQSRYSIDISTAEKKNIAGFDYICYWAYLKKDSALMNNLKILRAMKMASERISVR
ncbi:MAG: radical SAM protein [Deltaproteobacteria bacterium]|nr:radical SAM protein [Deltaproteobacteria bacterium]